MCNTIIFFCETVTNFISKKFYSLKISILLFTKVSLKSRKILPNIHLSCQGIPTQPQPAR